MKNKVLILFFLLLSIFATCVFATESNVNLDVYEFEKESFTISSDVLGNVFVNSDSFEMLSNTSISGDLYLITDKAYLKSDVKYSNAISKDGSNAIEVINSYASINGNAFIICDEFVLEPGCEILGDLYIIANKIELQKSSTISGNLFAVSNDLILNGRVKQSVYASSNNFNMNYYGSIYQDLHLISENVTLNSIIDRNAYITATSIITNTDFSLAGNLKAESHKFNFSGEVDGNAIINSKELNFIDNINNQNVNCLISGDLNYSCNNDVEVGDSIVLGKITSSKYSEKIETKPAFSFKSFIVNLITFVVYVFIIAVIFKLLNKNYLNVKHEISVKNTLASFGIGILSFLIVAIIAFVLVLIPFGLTLSLALIFAYLFLLFIAIPIFVLDIALLLKNKLNLYLSIALIPLALYLISSIPVIGTLLMFIVLITGIGRICNKVLFKKC